MGTRISSTSLLFSTKKRNFWGRAEGTGRQGQREGQLRPPFPLLGVSPDPVPIPGLAQ